MAETSPVIGQLRQNFSISSTLGPSSPSSPAQLHPLTFDPLQGLIHEMALSAVIQKHTASLPSSITSSSSTHPTTYVQNIVVQPPLTPSPSTPSPDSHQHTSTVAPHGFIAVTSSAANKGSNMNTLPFLPQGVSGATQIYGAVGTPIALQQFAPGQEVATAVSASAGTPIVQLAPVGYTTAQGDNRTALFPQAGVIGYVHKCMPTCPTHDSACTIYTNCYVVCLCGVWLICTMITCSHNCRPMAVIVEETNSQ